ncbi:hypothetical protein DFP72DRAFT_801285 [Ephemerocybe angulata]|uniref:Uncharacterized protein n=1 Tax=Ephemerocybe angulata TaxID=980116 RepID=A0A8H6IFS3_9AGAR|nr:hypothetical protein DFP72DRAFT_801285 [Tulosesus angulatus]
MCLSTIFCKSSHILEPPERGLKQKSITGIFHSQEWERTVGCIGTVFGHRVLHAQLSMDAMQFTTRASFNRVDSSPNGSSSVQSALFSKIRSPAVGSRARASRVLNTDTFSLDVESTIPVYDCRNMPLDLSQDLGRLETFTRWTEEIPYGSFVVVAYTVAVFRAEKNKAWTVSFNLHWAMLLGTPA